MQRRCPGSKPLGPAKLPHYGLVFDGVSKNWSLAASANVVPREGAVVWGALYEVTEEHLAFLDKFEHAPVNYHRELVAVEGVTLGRQEAIVYLREAREPGLPSKAYLETILKGARENNIPPDYRTSIVELAQDAKEDAKAPA